MLRNLVFLVVVVTIVQARSSCEGAKMLFGWCGDDKVSPFCFICSILSEETTKAGFFSYLTNKPLHKLVKSHFCYYDSSRPVGYVCPWPPWCDRSMIFNNLPRASLSLCSMHVGLQVISVRPVGGSQRRPVTRRDKRWLRPTLFVCTVN